MTAAGALFPGSSGDLGAAAVRVALAAGCSANAALLFGRIVSWNGRPHWELRSNMVDLFRRSTRQITRYIRELTLAGLIVNKPSPKGELPPGAKHELPYRVWYRWAIGLPALRESLRCASRDAYARFQAGFERDRQARATRSRLGEILGVIVGKRSVPRPPRPDATSEPPRRRWTAEEIDAELSRTSPSAGSTDTVRGPPDTS